jgi:methylated-DNA-[protein]-cysteine S-methyltransferase
MAAPGDDSASIPTGFIPTGAILRTAIGWIDIRTEADAVTQLHWRAIEPGVLVSDPLAEEASRQVEAYLAGRLTRFDLPLSYEGSDFARRVWEMLLRIPYGETRRYGHLSALIGGEATGNDARAIGSACGQNPIAIIIPCHRVIGAAALGGYSGDLGLTAKRFLLDLEKGQGRLF